jgi:acyl-coenzyme A synthetase/AMP-(fatty) acid ligase
MTYRDLQRQIDAFTHGMQSAKFAPKSKLVIWAKDCAENVVAQLGAAKAGLTVQVLSADASVSELEQALVDARALLFSPTLLPEEGALKAVLDLIPELQGLPERANQVRCLARAKRGHVARRLPLSVRHACVWASCRRKCTHTWHACMHTWHACACSHV